MSFIRRKPPVKSGIERVPNKRFPGHRQWIRRHACIVEGCERRDIQACHVRAGLPAGEQAGKDQKPHDKWTLPMCGGVGSHHEEQHRIGEPAFCRKYGLDLVKIATKFAAASPHRHKWMEPQE